MAFGAGRKIGGVGFVSEYWLPQCRTEGSGCAMTPLHRAFPERLDGCNREEMTG